MTIVTMMERKECVEIDQAQLFQQFNLRADRDRHDMIFVVVEDITRILGRAVTQYLKTDYDNLRDSLDSVVTLAQNLSSASIVCCAGCEILLIEMICCVPPHFSGFFKGEQSLFAIGTCQSIHDWHLQFPFL